MLCAERAGAMNMSSDSEYLEEPGDVASVGKTAGEVSGMNAGGESPSAASDNSMVFDSPSSGAADASFTSMPSQFALCAHEQSTSGVVSGRPGKTSAGPPATVSDVSAASTFSMPSKCTFHSGSDGRARTNSYSNRRSRRSVTTSRGRKSISSTSSSLSSTVPMSHVDHCNADNLGHHQQNVTIEHWENNRYNLHGVQHDNAQQQQIGRFLVTPLREEPTIDMEINC